MKTLHNQTLIYDVDCPLCQVYTKGFIKTKMLDNNGRKPFKLLNEDEQKFVDINRAKDEIALIDNNKKKVIYGIDSLLKIIGNSFPLIETIGNFKPINIFLKKIYSFISYNRKVIIPSKISENKNSECIPSFNVKYRIIYIIFSILFTGLILFKFSGLIPELPKSTILRELIIAFGQIIFQILFLKHFSKKQILNYIGNLMSVSLFGSIIIIPLLIINSFINCPEIIIILYFASTVIIMFYEHYRRINLLKLPLFLCYTWIIYRLIALLIILN